MAIVLICSFIELIVKCSNQQTIEIKVHRRSSIIKFGNFLNKNSHINLKDSVFIIFKYKLNILRSFPLFFLYKKWVLHLKSNFKLKQWGRVTKFYHFISRWNMHGQKSAVVFWKSLEICKKLVIKQRGRYIKVTYWNRDYR